MTVGTLSFLVTTPEVWVPDLGSGEAGFPLLSGAGRLVVKDTGYPRRGTRRSFGFGPAHPAEKERRRDTKPLTRKERPARYPAPRVTNRRSERV
ncbi:MAG: DUF417 family protein [Alistipes indistinctus]